MEKEFKAELKALLEKYNAAIGFDVGEYCAYDIYDEEMTVYFFNTRKTVNLNNGWSVTAKDI